MSTLPPERLPETHHRFHGVFNGETEDGMRFQLEVGTSRKRLNGGEMMKAHIKSMSRGRPLTDLYKEIPAITLYVPNQFRTDIEVLDNGLYRYGRHVERSLRKLVVALLDEMKPRSSMKP